MNLSVAVIVCPSGIHTLSVMVSPANGVPMASLWNKVVFKNSIIGYNSDYNSDSDSGVRTAVLII